MIALHAGAVVSEYRISNVPTSPHIDGSTADKFDAAMQSMPTNAYISLGTGSFETMGRIGWSVKANQTIQGSGMGKTILMFPASAISSNLLTSNVLIGTQTAFYQTASNVTLEDITLDCNYQTNIFTTLNGANLPSGSHFKNVELIHCASFTKSASNYVESFGLTVSSFPFPYSIGGTFENCWVHGYSGNFNNDLSALNFFGVAGRTRTSNCRIDGSGTNGIVFGGNAGSFDSTIEDCWYNSIQICIHADDGTGSTNLMVKNCHAIGVNQFIDWQNAAFKNIQAHGNIISLSNNVAGAATVAAFYFHPSGIYFNVDLAGNTVSGIPNAWFAVGDNMRGLTIHDNIFESALKNLINKNNSTGYSQYDNWLYGNVWGF